MGSILDSLGIANLDLLRLEATFGSNEGQNYDCSIISYLKCLWSLLYGGVDKKEKRWIINHLKEDFESEGWPILQDPVKMCEKIINEIFTQMEKEITPGTTRYEPGGEYHISNETIEAYKKIFQMVKDGLISLEIMEELVDSSQEHLHCGGCGCHW